MQDLVHQHLLRAQDRMKRQALSIALKDSSILAIGFTSSCSHTFSHPWLIAHTRSWRFVSLDHSKLKLVLMLWHTKADAATFLCNSSGLSCILVESFSWCWTCSSYVTNWCCRVSGASADTSKALDVWWQPRRTSAGQVVADAGCVGYLGACWQSPVTVSKSAGLGSCHLWKRGKCQPCSSSGNGTNPRRLWGSDDQAARKPRPRRPNSLVTGPMWQM
jgi:hypothetical protein